MKSKPNKPNARKKAISIATQLSEKAYRDIFDSTSDAIIVHSLTARKIIDVNKAALRMFGWRTKKEILASQSIALSVDESPITNEEALRRIRLAASGKPQKFEWLVKRRNGKKLWVEVNVHASHVGGEKRILAVVHDINARKQAEEVLRESRDRYRNLIDLAVDGVLVGSAKGTIIDANACMCTMTGRSREELVGKHIDNVFFSAESLKRTPLRFDLLDQGETVISERTILRPNGTKIPVEMRSKQMPDGTYQSIYRDITERKQAEEILRESESQYRQLWGATVEGIVIHDHGVIREVNGAMCKMFGVDREQVIGKSLLVFAPPDSHGILMAHMASGSEEPLETPAVRPDGTALTLELFSRQILYRGKTLRMAACRDITERRRAEEALGDSEARMRAIIDHAPFGAHSYELRAGEQLILVGVNNSADHILAFDHSPVVGKRIEDAFPGLAETQIPDIYRRVAATGESYASDQVVYEEGTIKGAFDIQAFQTAPNRMTVFFRDITERKRIEQAMHDSESRYRTLIESIADIVLVTDLFGRLLYCNPAFELQTGYAAQEFHSQGVIHSPYCPEDVERIRKIMSDFVQGQNASTDIFEYRLRHKTGSLSWQSAIANRITYRGTPAIQIISRNISERKRAEEALRESENLTKSIFRAAPVGIGSVTNRVLTEANAKLCEITGYLREELLGQSARLLYPNEEEFDLVGKEKYRQIAESGTGTVETFWQRKDGAIIDVLLSSTPIDPLDLSHGVTFTALDITERKRAEDMLRRYQLLSENTRDIILFVRSADGQILEANEAAVQAYGYNREELLTKSIRDLRAQETTAELAKQLEDASRAGLSFETLHRRRDGAVFSVEVSSRGMTVGNDRILMSIIRDVTERKQAEQALRESEAQYRYLIETMPDGVYRSTHEGKFLEVNPAMVKMLGYDSKEELLAIDIKAQLYFAEEDRESAALEEKNEEMAVFRLRKKDGSDVWVEDHGRHVTDDGGNVRYHEGILRDITERKRMEEDRVRIDKQIQQTQKLESLGLLAGGIAHDFNNLLSGIFGYVELAKRNVDVGDSAKASNQLLKALNVFGRARDLSRQLITFSKGGHLLRQQEILAELCQKLCSLP